MPRDLLGGFKRNSLADANEEKKKAQSTTSFGQPLQSLAGAPQPQLQAQPSASQGMGNAPVGNFVGFDRMLGLNREKVDAMGKRLEAGATGKVSAAADAYGKAKQNFNSAVGAGTLKHYDSNLKAPNLSVAPQQPAPQGPTLTSQRLGSSMGPEGQAVTGQNEGLSAKPTKGPQASAPTVGAMPNSLEGKPVFRDEGVRVSSALLDGFRPIGMRVDDSVYAPKTIDELRARAATENPYTGPDDITQAQGWQDAVSAAGVADRSLANLNNGAGGIAAELGYSTPEGGALSGNAALDAGLVQGAAGDRLSQLQKRYGNLTKDLTTTAVDASKGVSGQAKHMSQWAKERYGGDAWLYDDAQKKQQQANKPIEIGAAGGALGYEPGAALGTWSSHLSSPDGWGSKSLYGDDNAWALNAMGAAGISPEEASSAWNGMTPEERDAVMQQAMRTTGSGRFNDNLGEIAKAIAARKKKGAK